MNVLDIIRDKSLEPHVGNLLRIRFIDRGTITSDGYYMDAVLLSVDIRRRTINIAFYNDETRTTVELANCSTIYAYTLSHEITRLIWWRK